MSNSEPSQVIIPPKSLVQTWLDILNQDQEAYTNVHRFTLRKIERIFGSVEVAQIYLDS